MKVPFLLGAYTSKSLIASAQRCLNLYPEVNPEGAPFPTTLYQTPGLNCIGTPLNSDFSYKGNSRYWRCLYVSSNNKLYGVCGADVWRIEFSSGAWSFTNIGTIETVKGQCYMLDNRADVLLVDGSNEGYTISLDDDSFTQIDNEAFYGSNMVDMLDGYLLLNRPDSNQWYISDFFNVDFDALDFAAKTGFNDDLLAVRAVNQQVFLFGEETIEVWYNSGDSDFTFSRMPGAFIQHGCAAVNSIVQMKDSLYWVGGDNEGNCTILRTENYSDMRISTHAIEQEISKYPRVDDAVGYSYQKDGHYFYVLSFPSGDATWVWDETAALWHERAYIDDNGVEHRHLSNCCAFWKGMHIVGSHNSRNLYIMTEDAADDAGQPIKRLVSSPHGVTDGNRVRYNRFIVDISSGGEEIPGNACPIEPDDLLPACVVLNYTGENDAVGAFANGVDINPNGEQVFIVGGFSGSGDVERYGMTSPFDQSTLTAVQQTLNIDAQVPAFQLPSDIKFSKNGTRMFVLMSDETIFQWNLSTAYDLTTAVYSGKSFNMSAINSNMRGFCFDSTGLIMFVSGYTTEDAVYRFDLGAVGEIDTAAYTGTSLDVSGQTTIPIGVAIIGNGTRLLVVASDLGDVLYYNLATPYDLNTATYGGAMTLTVVGPSWLALYSSNDMDYVYVVGDSPRRLHEYTGGECP